MDERRTCIVMATGPSLTREDADWCRGWPCVAVNDAYNGWAPWADVLFALDVPWWEHHRRNIRDSGFAGQLWTHAGAVPHVARHLPEIRGLPGEDGAGLSASPGVIRYGHNTGHAAMTAAGGVWGAGRIIALGLDCGIVAGKRHCFGDHPSALRNGWPLETMRKAFAQLAVDFARRGVEVINCSPHTRLKCWPVMPVRQVLERRA